MYAANFNFIRYVLHFFEDRNRIPARSRFYFSKSTSFIIISFYSCMYLIGMPFQIAFSDSFKCTLTSVQIISSGLYSWIIDRFFLKKTNFFMYTFCSLMRHQRSMFRFKLDFQSCTF